MSYLQLLLLQKEAEWKRAYANYHKSVMSIAENGIECDCLLDAIPEHILEHYHRSFQDYARVQTMVHYGSK